MQQLVRQSYRKTVEICKEIGCVAHNDLPGYTTRILDGNWLSGTEHRLEETRRSTAAPLPGKSLVVYDPRYNTDLRLLRDSKMPMRKNAADSMSVIATLEKHQLWLADRNFCTLKFLYAIAAKSGVFVIRQHGQLHGTEKGKLRKIGESETGVVYENKLVLPNYEGQSDDSPPRAGSSF